MRLEAASMIRAVVLLAMLQGAGACAAETELHRIRLHNRMGGSVTVSRDGGGTWAVVGHVLRPDRGYVHEIKDKEFTAADWAPDSAVAATAVNAIHLKVGMGRHATVMTVQPREFIDKAVAEKVASYLAEDASIYTDIPAGTGIFGAEAAPFVGDPVELVVGDRVTSLPAGYRPAVGDVLQIRVVRPAGTPSRIVFENRFGGSVMAIYPDGQLRVAQVYRPVTGVGRFGGSQFAAVGDVRANHPGVICVSTSPVGQIGGFQIVPSTHASHRDLDYVRAKAVWLVVGPIGALQRDLEGSSPLFRGHLRPRASRVQVRVNGGPWQELGAAVGLQESALMAVTHVQIVP
ncbi:MAG: hypothetical protein HY815_34130 [Candidatus Riflebacteria bacterium]|nr:hypothetical protein [Candidatus Riflebacteria bacterium]